MFQTCPKFRRWSREFKILYLKFCYVTRPTKGYETVKFKFKCVFWLFYELDEKSAGASER